MDVRDAANRWAKVWAQGWPTKDVDGIVGLQREDGAHWASMFRPYGGREGLRAYVQECFDEETRPAEVWFGNPQVDGDMAAAEYWAVTYPAGQPLTISGCTTTRMSSRAGSCRPPDHSSRGDVDPVTATRAQVASYVQEMTSRPSGRSAK